MGLIFAGVGAVAGTLADQWKEYFTCDAMPGDVLAMKGHKQTGRRSQNKKGSDNVITNGSGIAVADGQCVLITEQGRIVEVCAEPGLYTFDSDLEPTIFAGNLRESVAQTFETMARRFTYGGGTGNDQRVYYFNIKEIMDNKFGTPSPIPFRVVDRNIGLDIDLSVRCSGVYSYRIEDPLLFYANVCGNITGVFTKDELDKQLKTEFISALQPAFAQISALGIRPNALPGHAQDLADAMNEALSKKWSELRGIRVVSIALNPINLPEEDAQMLKQAQQAAIMRDPAMAAAQLTGAQADAMRSAAKNTSGAMTGFMGMGMAGQAGGVNAGNLYQMAQEQNAAKAAAGAAGEWICACGAANTGKFCTECGKPKPSAHKWICACGTANTGKFCTECGKKKPVVVCDKCGWEAPDPSDPPKFCPECGDPF